MIESSPNCRDQDRDENLKKVAKPRSDMNLFKTETILQDQRFQKQNLFLYSCTKTQPLLKTNVQLKLDRPNHAKTKPDYNDIW